MKQILYILSFVLISLATHASQGANKALVPTPTDTTVHWDTTNNMAYVNIVPVPWVRFEHKADRLYVSLLSDNLYSEAVLVWQVRCTDTVDAETFTHKVLQSGVYHLTGSDYTVWSGDAPYVFYFMSKIDFINVTITD